MIISQKAYHERIGDCTRIIETKFEVGDIIWYIHEAKYAKVVKSVEVLYVKTYKDGFTVFGCIDQTRSGNDKVIDIYLGDVFNSEQDATRWLELDKERNDLIQQRNFNKEKLISISREMSGLHASDFHFVKDK